MAWMDKKQEFVDRFDRLNTSESTVQQLSTDLNREIGSFIHTAGLNAADIQSNPKYESIRDKITKLNDIKQQYKSLHTNINTFLSDQSTNTDWNQQLRENGTIQNDIHRLEKIEKEMKVDVDSALARDELLRTRNTNVTKHDLYIFNHPVRRSIVPYLWVVSVLFIGIALLIFRDAFPVLQNTQGYYNASGYDTTSFYFLLYGFFSNRIVIVSLLVSALIVVLFLSLKLAGVL